MVPHNFLTLGVLALLIVVSYGELISGDSFSEVSRAERHTSDEAPHRHGRHGRHHSGHGRSVDPKEIFVGSPKARAAIHGDNDFKPSGRKADVFNWNINTGSKKGKKESSEEDSSDDK